MSQVAEQGVFFALLLGGMYLLFIRPQRARAQALAAVRSSLAVGSAVMTTAGLHATVAAVEDGTVLLEIAPGVRARFDAGAVVRVLDDTVAEPTDDEPRADAASGTAQDPQTS